MSKDQIRNLLLQEADYNVDTETKTPKRQEYLTWDHFFMSVALLSAMRSKDPNTPTGACIVDEEYRVIGIGYNGFPRKCSDDALPWTSSETNPLHSPDPYMCHAEVNAILNKCSDNVAGATLYVPHFPCNECAKVIVQSRIRQVVYMVDRDHNAETFRASRILFNMAGVKLRQYTPTDLPRRVELELVSFVDKTSNDTSKVNSLQDTSNKQDDKNECHKFRNLLVKEANYDPVTTPCTKRTDYLSWDDYFTAIAFLTAKRSKDPNTQVGACIVNENKCIIGLGYNGFPRGCSDDHLPWARQADSQLHTKYPFVCHAEVNAILNKCSANVKGATLYVALFPCNECAKLIIQAGIREVVYTSDKYHDTDCCRASRILFHMAGVKLRQYIPQVSTVSIDFDSVLGTHGK
jgi:dCMP deaminase